LDEIGPVLEPGDTRARSLFAVDCPALRSATGPKCALLRVGIERYDDQAASRMLRELRR
jgi:hypothetical protein